MANQNKKKLTQVSNGKSVEVLYQKIGNKWYAFSMVDNEVFTASLTEEEMQQAEISGLEKFIEMPNRSSNDEKNAA